MGKTHAPVLNSTPLWQAWHRWAGTDPLPPTPCAIAQQPSCAGQNVSESVPVPPPRAQQPGHTSRSRLFPAASRPRVTRRQDVRQPLRQHRLTSVPCPASRPARDCARRCLGTSMASRQCLQAPSATSSACLGCRADAAPDSCRLLVYGVAIAPHRCAAQRPRLVGAGRDGQPRKPRVVAFWRRRFRRAKITAPFTPFLMAVSAIGSHAGLRWRRRCPALNSLPGRASCHMRG